MDFRPLIPKDPEFMDPHIFASGRMNLRDRILSILLE
jgi:acyl CoA:acetate/3-ketoacid CoA transferase